jgi:hypothetical protein
MAWWKPLAAIVLPPVLLLVLQILGYQLAGALTGSDEPERKSNGYGYFTLHDDNGWTYEQSEHWLTTQATAALC